MSTTKKIDAMIYHPSNCNEANLCFCPSRCFYPINGINDVKQQTNPGKTT